ncbi:MAG: D-aminoacyl-tRNA deacylase [Acutalibacteraceae bacterium]|jgi:D-tyrosyl-tRNA(Tyr) deacylase|nr:D-aminoacyl-tRNA deacylase [Acutalibacteraceae bacterium]
MKAVIQRVKSASVSVDGKVVGSCKDGYMILLCAVEDDSLDDVNTLAYKVANLRVFCDENGKMNKSVLDVEGEVLAISQFTLCADVKKGNRPSFIKALEPQKAEEFYNIFCEKLRENGIKRVEKGIFGADMQVSLLNDGPVTIIYDTEIWRKNGN